MKKFLFSALCAVLTAALLVSVAAYAASGDVTGEKSYTITSPYAAVDWDSWGAYKGNLHTHSTVSDASVDFSEMIEAYYAADFDLLAMTDHGVINRGWNLKPTVLPIFLYQRFIGNTPTWLSDERYAQITSGSDRGGRAMLDVRYGIELNALVMTKSHVNGFFCEYGEGMLGFENGFRRAVAGVERAGGISHLDHLGDWLDSREDITRASDPENVKFFADIFKDYPSCVGMEILNNNDSFTRYDRILWDEILQLVIPSGRNVWGFGNSDAHKLSDIDTSWGTYMMPELTEAALRECMESGAFFAMGRRAIGELGDVAFSGEMPAVTRVTVDDEHDSITIDARSFNTIEWVADGKVIAEGASIDLNAFEDDITCYVRAQIFGDGGVCFTQPFVVDDGTLYDEVPDERTQSEKFRDGFEDAVKKIFFVLSSTRVVVMISELIKIIKKQVAKNQLSF